MVDHECRHIGQINSFLTKLLLVMVFYHRDNAHTKTEPVSEIKGDDSWRVSWLTSVCHTCPNHMCTCCHPHIPTSTLKPQDVLLLWLCAVISYMTSGLEVGFFFWCSLILFLFCLKCLFIYLFIICVLWTHICQSMHREVQRTTCSNLFSFSSTELGSHTWQASLPAEASHWL